MKKQFCPYCGEKLDEGAQFCQKCGEPIYSDEYEKKKTLDEQSYTGNPTKRKIVYEGYIHKCPNCGEILNSFSTKCPTCGYEIRNRQVVNSVRELVGKLEMIEAEQMDLPLVEPVEKIPETEELPEEPISAMKKLIGWDFQENKRRESAEQARIAKEEERERVRKEQQKNVLRAEQRFERQKQIKKVNLIRNFPIPNTKEDILEFTLLVSANISAKNADPYIVLKAWMDKLNQVYQKALLLLDQDSDLKKVQEIYQQVIKQWEVKKKRYHVKCVLNVMVKSILAIAGIVLFLIAISIDKNGGNSSLHELIGVTLLIISAATLTGRGASILEILVVACSGGLSFLLANFLDNGSMLQLGGVVVVIISAVSFFKKILRREEK